MAEQIGQKTKPNQTNKETEKTSPQRPGREEKKRNKKTKNDNLHRAIPTLPSNQPVSSYNIISLLIPPTYLQSSHPIKTTT